MLLKVDYREHQLIEILKDTNLNYSVVPLTIGDIIIEKDSQFEYVIERKTYNDLCSSIKDSRFREQKSRLLESTNDASKIIYIIEGNKNLKYSLPISTINSAIQNLMFKHKYHVILSDSPHDTIEQIKLLYKKIEENELTNNCSEIKTIKKSDKMDVYINQLCVIPGISLNIAKCIKEIYPNMKYLVENIDVEKLKNIQVTPKRKLGEKLSLKINSILSES